MITPVSILTIKQICDRQNDLIVSAEDIKEVADNAKNKVAEKTAEAISNQFNHDVVGEFIAVSDVKKVIEFVIKDIKDGEINVY